MIQQLERYHGAALARLVRVEGSRTIALRLHERYRAAYVLGEHVVIYMKYSTNRLSPWVFSFRPEHQDEIAALEDEFDRVFVVLICGSDGVVCLSDKEHQHVIGRGSTGASESVRVARGPRQKYAVSGSDSGRALRIGDNEYPAKVFSAIGSAGQS